MSKGIEYSLLVLDQTQSSLLSATQTLPASDCWSAHFIVIPLVHCQGPLLSRHGSAPLSLATNAAASQSLQFIISILLPPQCSLNILTLETSRSHKPHHYI